MTVAQNMPTGEGVSPDFIPLKRGGTKEDMVSPTLATEQWRLRALVLQGGLILYLATRAGAYTNGDVSVTDGGRLGLFASTY
jgi:hypothetical protein